MSVSVTLWIVWAIIGIIGGAMSGRLFTGSGRTVLLIVVGVAGSLLGGWIMTAFGGIRPDTLEYLSLLTSACGCAILLWPAIALLRKNS